MPPGGEPWLPREARSLVFLALCWGCTLSASTLLTSVGPLAAKSLGASDTLATAAVGGFLAGAALISVPSSALFRKYGRGHVFLGGCALGGLGGIVGVAGVHLRLWWLIVLACFLSGLSQGVGQFYRFAAVDVCHDARKPFAVTLVLSGGVLAAFVGPQLAQSTANLLPSVPEYLCSFLSVLGLAALNALSSLCVQYPPRPPPEPAAAPLPPTPQLESPLLRPAGAWGADGDCPTRPHPAVALRTPSAPVLTASTCAPSLRRRRGAPAQGAQPARADVPAAMRGGGGGGDGGSHGDGDADGAPRDRYARGRRLRAADHPHVRAPLLCHVRARHVT